MSKCPMCGSAVEIKIEDFHSHKTDLAGMKIVIPMKVNYCTNAQCSHTWIAHHEEVRFDKAVKSASRHRLVSSEIQAIRNALGFSTRSETASFLNLNEKAFTKWEKGYFPMSDAYDLLLRLTVHSRSNFEFIKHLQEKQFKFEVEDYELLCEKQGVAWRYAKPNIKLNLHMNTNRPTKPQTAYFKTPTEVINSTYTTVRNLKVADPQVA